MDELDVDCLQHFREDFRIRTKSALNRFEQSFNSTSSQPSQDLLLMCVHEEGVLPIRLVRICQLLLHQRLFLFTQVRSYPPILPVQVVIGEPQRNDNKDLRTQARNNRDLPTDVSRSLLRLEGLSAQDIANSEGDERQGVNSHLLTVSGDVGCVPC
jgi:hypothetical protein